MPKPGLPPGHLSHILTVVLQPRPTAPCPATDSPLSRERGMGEGVVHTGGTANQRLGERLSVLQHGVRRQGSNRGSVTWRSRTRWHSMYSCCYQATIAWSSGGPISLPQVAFRERRLHSSLSLVSLIQLSSLTFLLLSLELPAPLLAPKLLIHASTLHFLLCSLYWTCLPESGSQISLNGQLVLKLGPFQPPIKL